MITTIESQAETFLERISQFDGFIASAYGNYREEKILIKRGAIEHDLEKGTLPNIKQLRAKLKSIRLSTKAEDVILLSKGHAHILHICEKATGFFFYLVFNPAKCNYWTVRQYLSKIDSELAAD